MRCAILFLAVLLGSASAQAGAWLMPQGKGLFLAQAGYFQSDDFFDSEGNTTAQPPFRKWEIQPYVEYGLTDKVTVGATTYLQEVNQSGAHNQGMADPEFFARATLWENPKGTQRLSLQPLIKLPSLFLDGGTPRGGSRSVDAELSLLYGRNLKLLSPRDFADLRVGYRERSRGLNGQWRVDAALGLYVTDDIQLIPAFRTILASKYDDEENFSENAEQDFDLMKAELTVAYHLDDTHWLQLTAFDHMAGVQVGAGRGLMLGIAERF